MLKLPETRFSVVTTFTTIFSPTNTQHVYGKLH
jgi:hypothetical protein